MPTFLAEILTQVRGIWARLDGGQRLIIGVVLLATIAGLGSIVWFAGRPDYTAVFSSDEPREVMRAAQALQGDVGYRIKGASLMVDGGDLADARGLLSAAGVWTGSTGGGSELTGMLSDRLTRMHGLAKMVERDAEAKLMRLRGVIHAQVSHSKPKRSAFKVMDVETQPRAHVGLRLSPGIDFRAVARIAAAEAAAALGMPPTYVVVTNLGTMERWSMPDGDRTSTLDTSEFLAQQRRRSVELTTAAQSMLDRIYPEKAMVRVTVLLDPEWKLTKQRGAPAKQIVLRTKTTKEDTVEPSGVADLSGGSGAVGTAVQTRSSQTKQIKETEYSEAGFLETSLGSLAPDIRRMSVALVVDKEVLQAADKAELTNQIKRAIGWKDGRDDEITILEEAFPELAELPSAPGLDFLGLLAQHGPAVGQVIGVVLVLLFLRGLLKKAAVPQPGAGDSKAGSPGANDSPSTVELSPDEAHRRMRREIEQAVGEDPAAVSRLLENWLTEQRS